MIVSKQKPFAQLLVALGDHRRVFLVGCAKCATVCKAGGEEQLWQMQELLTAQGFDPTGSIVIDEACHMLRVQRDLRSKQQMLDEADAVLVLACGAGVQSVAAATPKPVIAGLDTLFLGNIRRFGQFEQRCSLCGDCIVTETAGICPVTTCAKGLLNGPCGGMSQGRCELDRETDCAWVEIIRRLEERGAVARLEEGTPPKDYGTVCKPARLKLDK